MIRGAILFLLCLGLLLLISPFAISSFFIDQRGVTIPGHVYYKDESIVVRNSTWIRSLDVTVEYQPPQESSVAFLATKVNADRFDQLKKGDLVQLHYLRREDVPNVPGASTLRQLHLLPAARLANQRAWSALQLEFGKRSTVTFEAVVAVVLLLILWRMARLPLFGWAVGVCVLSAMAVMLIHEFPTPVRPPQNEIRSASGLVKSLDRVEWLFQDSHEKGLEAAQPIQIIGVQFIPEGRTEPVIAVDLIDAGSLPGLREHAPISIDYEKEAPRTARVHGATREFVRRNLRGIATEIVACLAVIAFLLFGASLLGKGYRQLTQGKNA